MENKLLTIFNESGPLIRIIEIAPTPRAVEIAAIVSSINILLSYIFLDCLNDITIFSNCGRFKSDI